MDTYPIQPVLPGELFRTIHGSSLYGFNHDNSDIDIFIVVADNVYRDVALSFGASTNGVTTKSAKAIHHVDENRDLVVMKLSRFLEKANQGAHQSLEALFSPLKQYTLKGKAYEPFFDAIRILGPEVFDTYERTIRSFVQHHEFKRRRHGYRLDLSLHQLRNTGRFNPVLTKTEIELCNNLANLFNLNNRE